MGWKYVCVFEEVFGQAEGMEQGHFWKCLQAEEEAATLLGRSTKGSGFTYNISLAEAGEEAERGEE